MFEGDSAPYVKILGMALLFGFVCLGGSAAEMMVEAIIIGPSIIGILIAIYCSQSKLGKAKKLSLLPISLIFHGTSLLMILMINNLGKASNDNTIKPLIYYSLLGAVLILIAFRLPKLQIENFKPKFRFIMLMLCSVALVLVVVSLMFIVSYQLSTIHYAM